MNDDVNNKNSDDISIGTTSDFSKKVEADFSDDIQEIEKNRIKSPKEVAQTELFSIPPKVDLESVNESMNEQYAIAKKKRLQDEQNSAKTPEAKQVELKAEIEPSKQEPLEKDDSTSQVNNDPSPLLKKKIQEKIDFTNVTTTLYNSEETENSRNYKRMFSKLIKKTEESTEPFKLEEQEEGVLVKADEVASKELPNLIEENDSTLILDGISDKNEYDRISKRTYSPKTAVDDTNNFVFINKLIFAVLATVSLIAIIETGVMYFVINTLNPIHRVYYYIAALIAIIPLGVGLFKYSFNPKLTIKKNFSYPMYFLNAIIVVIILLVILLVIVLLTSISLVDPTDFVPKIILPCLYIINYPIGVIIFMIYEKAKLFNIKEKN